MYIFLSFSFICFPLTNKAIHLVFIYKQVLFILEKKLFILEKKQQVDHLSGSFCTVLVIEVNCFGRTRISPMIPEGNAV